MRLNSPSSWALAYGTTLIAFVGVDFIWLSTMSDRLYRPVLGPMLAQQFALGPAILFYLFYIAGLIFLAVMPGVRAGSVVKALVNGAVLGFTAYETYDLTNQATLQSWSTVLTIADIVWGTCLSGFAATIGALVTLRWCR
jgi:uncharacterized membrane protein